MDEIQRLKEENKKLKDELSRIQSRCRHPKSFIIKKHSLAEVQEGNPVVYRCPDCGSEFEGTD